jgi:redox-sensitive bicupin YhaK (pirin superfamily)
MITIRKANDRGHARHGWLDSHHTFSFADYHDPDHMGFRTLRVINEDRVEPGQGFGTHPHRDMEIISYVLEGSLEHKDSMGTSSVIRPGEVQRMSAGTGVLHSEYNPSNSEPVHFLQIWISPERKNLKPGYEQKAFPEEARKNKLRLVASRDGRDGSLTIHQDAELYTSLLSKGGKVRHALPSGRFAWIQVTRGSVSLNGQALNAGDGASVGGEKVLELSSTGDAEVLLFDLA